jgi:hypothetical protein
MGKGSEEIQPGEKKIKLKFYDEKISPKSKW